MRTLFLAVLFVTLSAGTSIGQANINDSLLYLSQEPPGSAPERFAPGIISTGNEYEFGSAFSKEGDEFYYAVRLNSDWKAEIRHSELQNGQWTKPKRIGLDDKYSYNDPYISPDGSRLYFISDRALDGQGDVKDIDLWYIQRTDKGWSEPINAGEAINSEKDEYYISISNAGTIYFASNIHTSDDNTWDFDIFNLKLEGERSGVPVNMGDSINTKNFECDAFVSPDETYIIFCSVRPDGYGKGDLYVSFKDDEGFWTEAIGMGEVINTETHEFCPYVTKDGKYLFYTSNEDIYWVDAGIIDILRKEHSRSHDVTAVERRTGSSIAADRR